MIVCGLVTPQVCQDVMKQLLSGLLCLRQNNVIHRDLKPENILFKLENGRYHLFIADFNLCKTIKNSNELLSTICGSELYIAPEVIEGREGYIASKVDVWSAGIIFYLMLFDRLPFDRMNCNYTYCIAHKQITPANNSNPAANDLLLRMLTINVQDRINVAECIAHQYFAHSTH